MESIVIALISFFGVLIASLVGAMLAPSFSHFLNDSKNKREKNLENLEETYLLAKKIYQYTNQIPAHIIFLTQSLKNQKSIEDVPKLIEEPFSRIDILLDYHLKAPKEIILKTRGLKDETLSVYEPILKAITKVQSNKEEFYEESIEKATSSYQQGAKISNELIEWVKSEKNKLDLESDITWLSRIKNCC